MRFLLNIRGKHRQQLSIPRGLLSAFITRGMEWASRACAGSDNDGDDDGGGGGNDDLDDTVDKDDKEGTDDMAAGYDYSHNDRGRMA
ncbi:hypothetical protein [Paenibacillus sp. SN-8-1]|uniref:hypothetical protein n=1 Tax=Paenibacillus sp. SN-8-1 TaxID=3435409 RepID=UPI003D9AAB40